MLDYRFPTALQMVLSVAMAEQLGERSTSAILAYGLEANPSFIRKLMVPSRVTALSSLRLAATALFILVARPKRSPCAISTFRSSKIKSCGRRARRTGPLRGQRQRVLVFQIDCR
jgi:Rrf2 family transcriptional repressor of oqxAB